jgi:hypothetical protein
MYELRFVGLHFPQGLLRTWLPKSVPTCCQHADISLHTDCGCCISQGLLRTREVLERLKSVPPTPGQKPAILVYLGVLLQRGKLNALESAELAR